MKQDLENIVGKENVSVAKEVLVKYSKDYSLVPSGMPDAVAYPKTSEEVSAIVKWANEKKIVPIIEDRLPLEEVNQVYDRLKSGKIIGRIVLEP